MILKNTALKTKRHEKVDQKIRTVQRSDLRRTIFREQTGLSKQRKCTSIFQCGIFEKVLKGTRSFQIWFDPHFYETVKLKPSYKDYYGKDLSTVIENGIETLIYVGEGSGTKVTTPNLTIKKLIFKERTKTTYPLKKSMSYTFYALYGEGFINGEKLDTDDAIRISDTDELEIDFKGEVFFVETPTELDYEPIWSYKQS